MPRKRKPVGQRSRERRDLLGLADYFEHMAAQAFRGDMKAVTATMNALGWTPEQVAEELAGPWYRHRDLAEAVGDGETVARSNRRIIAGPGSGLEDAESIRRKLRRELARQGRNQPRGRPKKPVK